MDEDAELAELRRRRREEILRLASGTTATAATPSTGADGPRNLTAADFDPFLASHERAMVDFWAAWCGPCHRVAPVVEQLASEWQGRLAVGKVDVDAEPALAARFRVMSIPAILFFKRGQLAGRLAGAQPKAAFERALAELSA